MVEALETRNYFLFFILDNKNNLSCVFNFKTNQDEENYQFCKTGGAICLFVNVLNAQTVTWTENGSLIQPDKNYDVKLPQGLQLNSRILFQDGSTQNTAYVPTWERITGTNNIAYNFYGGFVGIGMPDPDANLQVSGKIRVSNPNHKGCHLEIGQDGANTYIEARALGMPNNGFCNLLINYYGHQPIGLFGKTSVHEDLYAVKKVGIGTDSPVSDLHIKGSIPNIRVENIGSGAAYMTFASPDYSWFTGVSAQNEFQIIDYFKQQALFNIDGPTGNASLGDIKPVADHRLRITGSPGSKAAILFTNANHNGCQVTMGQDGANAIIDASAPSNISSCQLLLNYYNHKPIGVWGEMTCKRDVIIGGQFDNNGLLIQNTGLETLQENRTDNVNAIGLKISHSGTDRFVVKGDGSLNIMPYGTGTRAISVKNDTGIDQFVVYSDGKVYAPEIRVKPINPWPDYVFEKDYKLMPLSELQKYIEKNKHLPGIPSAQEIEKENSLSVSDIQIKTLEKLEELYRYVLQLEQENQELKKKVEQLIQK